MPRPARSCCNFVNGPAQCRAQSNLSIAFPAPLSQDRNHEQMLGYRELLDIAAKPHLVSRGSGGGSILALNAQIDETAREANCSPDSREPIRATVLLWHDHLDAAHAIVQNIENADGSYLH